MISAVYFINKKGDIILYRKYRDDVSRNAADNFRTQVVGVDSNNIAPITEHNNCFFFHIRVSDMFVVVASRSNVNAMTCFHFLYSMVKVFEAYFEGTFSQRTVRNYFVLIYELLDELMDFGYPQITNEDMLKLYILSEQLKKKQAKKKATGSGSDVSVQVTGAVSWRTEGIKHKKNEIYIDVIEKVNLLVGKNGRHIRADVSGHVMCKAFLSGMPECQLGLNDRISIDADARKVGGAKKKTKGPGRSGLKDPHAGDTQIELDDLFFHQCVKLNSFESDRMINFVPPDGEFELMRYRITDRIIIPFRTICNITDESRSRLRMQLNIKCLVDARLFAINVQVFIPVPPNAASADFSIDPKARNMQGHKVKFDPIKKRIVWKMKRIQGKTSIGLGCDVQLVSSMLRETQWAKPPINMSFQVPMFMASGIHVRYLNIHEKSDYSHVRWIRYLTKSGQYEHRLTDGRDAAPRAADFNAKGTTGGR